MLRSRDCSWQGPRKGNPFAAEGGVLDSAVDQPGFHRVGILLRRRECVALKRHAAGETRIVPIILRAVDWHSTPLGKLLALPKDGKAVTSWSKRDEALLDVATGVRKVVEEL